MPDIGKFAKQMWDVGMAYGEMKVRQEAADEEAERLCEMSESVAKRQVQVKARNSDTGRFDLGDLIDALDRVSQQSYGEKADLAAELARYGDTLR
jgi:hypothetical protein